MAHYGKALLAYSMSMERVGELERDGRIWLRGFFTGSELSALAERCGDGQKPGLRLKTLEGLSDYVGAMSPLADAISGYGLDRTPVRLVAFDKSSTTNWALPWHQDRVVALRERREVAGYANWGRKDGAWHAEPPIELLLNMVFVRIHIDRSDALSGALEIALGSHAYGRIPTRDCGNVAAMLSTEICTADAGDVLVVKALTVHRSRASIVSRSRRTLRVDYARRDQLAQELQWAVRDDEAGAPVRR